MHVFKIGGSLQGSARLQQWLRMLAEYGAGKVVIVPGGGRFADAVREAQREAQFDQRSAHRMALLAMAQYGYALCGIEPRLVPANSLDQVRAVLLAQRLAVWLPLDLLDTRSDIEESWRMTSDSLAAWLAGQLGAVQLVLVKAGCVPSDAGIAALSQSGVVDELFAAYARAAACPVRVVGEDAIDSMRAALAAGE